MPDDLSRIIAALIRNIEALDGIFRGRIHARMMAIRSLSKAWKWKSKKSRNRLWLDNSVSRVASIRMCAILHVYTWHIVFMDALPRRGACTTLSFCTSHPPHPLHRPPSHSPFPVSEFAVSRVDVIVLRCIPQGRLLRRSVPRIRAQTLLFFAIC